MHAKGRTMKSRADGVIMRGLLRNQHPAKDYNKGIRSMVDVAPKLGGY